MMEYSVAVLSLMAVSAICFLLCILFWFVFRIPYLFFMLTGIGAKREIKKMSAGERRTPAPSAGFSFSETAILTPKDNGSTVVLSEEEIIASSRKKETLVSETGLLIQKDVVIRSDDRQI